jgi:hypothetical protein
MDQLQPGNEIDLITPDGTQARFRILMTWRNGTLEDCISVEVQPLTDYLESGQVLTPRDFTVLHLTTENGRWLAWFSCLEDYTEIISDQVTIRPGNPMTVIPLTSEVRPSVGNTLRFLYFNPTTFRVEQFEGQIVGFDPSTNRYRISRNGQTVEIGFQVEDNKVEPYLWNGIGYTRFSNSARPRIIL